jgi:membrane protease YdiL (CAAX protease family)
MTKRTRALTALALLVPVPSAGVLLAMVLARGPCGQAVYGLGKAWILILPAAWWVWIDGGRLSWSPPRRGGLGAGFAVGLLIAAAIVAAYVAVGRLWLDPARLRAVAAANGLGHPRLFVVLAAYWILVNAPLEEYVWRWFVFRQCQTVVGSGRFGPRTADALAVAWSAALFTLHHLVALRAQMPWPPALLACLGVFLGGATWSALYRRYGSIWPGCLSHALADLAIFTIAWRLLFA